MGERYQVAAPSGADGVLYLSMQEDYVPRATLTIWKRPEGVFAKGVQDALIRLAPKFKEIANDNQLYHEGAHRYQPDEFHPKTHYMQHIHIASNSLVKKTQLPVFLYSLVQQGYLPQNEVEMILAWVASVLDGAAETSDSDSGSESDDH